MRLGALVLSLVALCAIFVEVLAAEAPVVAFGKSGATLLPAVTAPERYRHLSREAIANLHAGDVALWPLVRFGPHSTSADGPDASPSLRHPLGTDGHGRDLWARLIYGARTTLGVALVALVVALLFGTLFGAIAGYIGGVWDEGLSRAVEVVATFPAVVVVAIARAVYPEASILSLALAIAAVRWAEVARLVRAEVIRTMGLDFVAGARALGCGPLRILVRHVLPQAAQPLMVSSMFGVVSVVLVEVAVSFLGIGSDASWGAMLSEGLDSAGGIMSALFAALAVAATVGAVLLLADATGETLDARVAQATLPHDHDPRV
jgi:peptide/nickel transport system permease protein